MLRQTIRKRDIIGIHSRNEATARGTDALVQRPSDAAWRQRQNADTWVNPGVQAGNDKAIICRGIIENKELKVGETLRPDARYRFIQEAARIAHWNNNANNRLIHGGIILSLVMNRINIVPFPFAKITVPDRPCRMSSRTPYRLHRAADR